jgi:hypothetical protein
MCCTTLCRGALCWLFVVALVGATAARSAAFGQGTPPASPPPKPALPSDAREHRDPTVPGGQLQFALEAGGRSVKYPIIEIKGRIMGGACGDTALLKIDDRIYQVRRGSELHVPGPREVEGVQTVTTTADKFQNFGREQNREVTKIENPVFGAPRGLRSLRVVEITAEEVVVEIGSAGLQLKIR